MKTSNIILIAFIVAVFLTPLLMTKALEHKIAKDAYTRIIDNNRTRKLLTGEYKHLHVSGSSRGLQCTIIKDDSSYIEYEQYGRDSVGFKLSSDTLLVAFTPSKDSSIEFAGSAYLEIEIHVKQPDFMRIEGISAYINPDTFFASHPVNISLRDASFRTSKNIYISEETIDTVEDPNYFDRRADTIPLEKYGHFSQLTIKADSSEVHLGSYVFVKELKLNISGFSVISMSNVFKAGRLSGFVSDSSRVLAPWYLVKQLKGR